MTRESLRKKIFIRFELARAKRQQNTLSKDLFKFSNQQPKKRQPINYNLGTDLYSMLTDKVTIAMITDLFKVGKKARVT